MRKRIVFAMLMVVVVGLVWRTRMVDRRVASSEGQGKALAEPDEEDGSKSSPSPAVVKKVVYPVWSAQEPSAPAVAAPERRAVQDQERASTPTAEDQVIHVDSVWASQASEAGWARDAERTINDGLKGLTGGGSHVQSVECRASLCRAKLVHDAEDQFQAFVEKAFSAGQFWRGASMSYREPSPPGAPIANTVFFAKLGTDMPYLD